MEIMKQIQTWTDSLCGGIETPAEAFRPVSARTDVIVLATRLRGGDGGFPKHNLTLDSAPGACPV